MLTAVLKNKSTAVKITVKGAISVLMIVLAVALPQIAHIAGGAAAGAVYLPMYAPALIAGCILGWQWGLGVGALSPLASFAFTSLFLDSAMPAAARLPYMVAELAVFGLVSGLFCKKIAKNALFAFPAVIAAQVAGRLIYFVSAVIFGQSAAAVWGVIESGLTGLYIQAAIVPVIVLLLSLAVKNDCD